MDRHRLQRLIMPRRRAPFTQADITRAIKAAKAAGVEVGSVDIAPDGRIIIRALGAQPKEQGDALADWEAMHGDR